jgi:hypothetical protein
MRRLVVLGVSVVLLAAACGGDDSSSGDLSSNDQEIADAIFDQMMADTDPDDPFGETEARCFSDGVVRDIGAGDLAELGMTAEAIRAGTEPVDVDLTDEQVDAMADVMLECVDFRSVFIDQFAEEGISDESAECLADGFDDDFLRALAKAEFSGDGADPTSDPAQAEKFFNLITDCLSFEEMSNLGG